MLTHDSFETRVKRKIDETELTFSAPCPHASPATGSSAGSAYPVNGAQTVASWLQTVVSPSPSKPSAELVKILQLHDRDMTGQVVRKANVIVTALFPSSIWPQPFVSRRLSVISPPERRRSDALKLYYRVLESICVSETQKSTPMDVFGLMTNERFHRALLAACAQLVSTRYTGGFTMSLSFVFERTGVTGYDLSRVMETIILHEKTLPRELKRRLNSLEEQLLESRVWERGSSLYNALSIARPHLSSEIVQLGLLAEPLPPLDSISLHFDVPISLKKTNLIRAESSDIMSLSTACNEQRHHHHHHHQGGEFDPPASPKLDYLPASSTIDAESPSSSPSLHCSSTTSFTQQNQQSRCGDAADKAIRFLFSKMTKLAAIRIQCFAERLSLSEEIRHKVYLLFQKIINQKTFLFFNRHIDQIILCCFYTVAKVYELNLTFANIIDGYKNQPETVRYIPRNCTENRGDCVGIIVFYNTIFIPSVASTLEDIKPAGPLERVAEARNHDGSAPFPSLPDMSPKKVSPSHNVYLSKLQPSKKEVLDTSVCKSYYAFIGEAIDGHTSPSQQLSAINSCLNSILRKRRCRRRLNFDKVEPVMVGGSVDLDSVFHENKTGASISSF